MIEAFNEVLIHLQRMCRQHHSRERQLELIQLSLLCFNDVGNVSNILLLLMQCDCMPLDTAKRVLKVAL